MVSGPASGRQLLAAIVGALLDSLPAASTGAGAAGRAEGAGCEQDSRAVRVRNRLLHALLAQARRDAGGAASAHGGFVSLNVHPCALVQVLLARPHVSSALLTLTLLTAAFTGDGGSRARARCPPSASPAARRPPPAARRPRRPLTQRALR